MLRPLRALLGFARRFGENLDAEAARIDIRRLCRTGLGPPRSLAGPVLIALATTIREQRAARRAAALGARPQTPPGASTVRARGITM